jgi:Kef-type K+ transport system membrane component KefB
MKFDPKGFLLIGAALIVLLPFLLWWVLRLHKLFPLAVIQILTGIVLGPSVLGAVLAPELYDALFSKEVKDGIGALAAISVCLFAFLAGAEMDLEVIRSAGRSVAAIGVFGLLLTWAIGVAAGYEIAALHPVALGAVRDPALFAAAFGLCNAVPALPVLAAILNELQLNRHRIGAVSLAAAGLGDAILWCSVAAILSFAPSADNGGLFSKLAYAVGGGLAAYMLCRSVFNPLLQRMIRTKAPERVLMIVVGIAIFSCSAITQVTGLHAVLGALLVGIVLPDEIKHMAASKLDMPTSMLLLPFFFLSTGLDAHISASSTVVWTLFGTGLAICVIGKVLATTITARLFGEDFPFAVTAGVLLQTKGLMELVVVTVFRQNGIVSQETYSALVLVALVSTALTMPLTKLLLAGYRDRIEASGRTAKPPDGLA